VDAVFGTVIHRWCAQAVLGAPLTVYGAGGQRRGFIALEDSLRCLQLLLHHPPEPGEYRVVNQLDDVHRLDELVTRIVEAARPQGLTATVQHIPNPRLEDEDHSYDVTSEILPSLGYASRNAMDDDLAAVVRALTANAERLRSLEGVLLPDVSWVGGRRAGAAAESPVTA
jgi:UDP-sulfoquinovose synthase